MNHLEVLEDQQYQELIPFFVSGAKGSAFLNEIVEEIRSGEDKSKFILKSDKNPFDTLKQFSQSLHARIYAQKKKGTPYPFRVSVRRLKDESATVIVKIDL